jgi:hypothetical protein
LATKVIAMKKRVIFGDFDSDNIIEEGNIDLHNRPVVKNADGSISTVRSMSFEDDDGSQVLIPTVSNDGTILSEEDAIRNYFKTGQHLGKFKTIQSANEYAQKLHEEQEQYYTKKGR